MVFMTIPFVEPSTTKWLPEDYVERVKQIHESGGYGSRGYVIYTSIYIYGQIHSPSEGHPSFKKIQPFNRSKGKFILFLNKGCLSERPPCIYI